ncbi:MAG: MFS transporter [Coriobacteriaceae bacterium]
MALSQEKKGTIAVSLTNFLDSGCIVASGVALAAWAIAFNFDNVWVSILGAVGANAFGAAVGALIGGFLADRFGRKFIYTHNLLVYRHGRLLIMCAVNLPMLCAGIVISGLSVGAGVPSSWSYISEMSSSTSRAANIGISQFAFPAARRSSSSSRFCSRSSSHLRAGWRALPAGTTGLRRPVRHASVVPHPVRGGAHRVESAAQAGGVEGLDGKAVRG